MRLASGVRRVQQSIFKTINNMTAIETNYHSATESSGSKIIAYAKYGSETIKNTIPFPYELTIEHAHRAAAVALIQKVNSLGSDWPLNFVTGVLPDSTYCHVLQH